MTTTAETGDLFTTPAADDDGWQTRAECQWVLEPTIFDEDASAQSHATARQWCADCPVRQQCYQTATASEALPKLWRLSGVWGGQLFHNGKPVEENPTTSGTAA